MLPLTLTASFRQMKNGVFGTRVDVTCSTRYPGLPQVYLQKSRFPGDNDSSDAPPTGVSLHTGGSFRRSRSVASWAIAPTALVQPCRCTPQLFFRLGSWSLLLHFRPASRGCSSDGTLSLLRSALDRFLGRWYFTYQCSSRGADDRGEDALALFWPAIVEYPSGSPPSSRSSPPLAFALVAQSSRL